MTKEMVPKNVSTRLIVVLKKSTYKAIKSKNIYITDAHLSKSYDFILLVSCTPTQPTTSPSIPLL
jgi:hypothetical protein